MLIYLHLVDYVIYVMFGSVECVTLLLLLSKSICESLTPVLRCYLLLHLHSSYLPGGLCSHGHALILGW